MIAILLVSIYVAGYGSWLLIEKFFPKWKLRKVAISVSAGIIAPVMIFFAPQYRIISVEKLENLNQNSGSVSEYPKFINGPAAFHSTNTTFSDITSIMGGDTAKPSK